MDLCLAIYSFIAPVACIVKRVVKDKMGAAFIYI